MAEVRVLSQHQRQPREGNSESVYCVFWYLKCNLKYISGMIVFDSKIPDIDEKLFHPSDKSVWEDLYLDTEEAIRGNDPPPRVRPVYVGCYVDADHAGNLLARRSHTGIIIFVNNSPIIWYIKRHNTVESSRFGSEFIALRIATEMIEGLRYNLRMFGVTIDGTTDVFCDNQSVVTNVSIPSYVLNKKYNSICYHRVREAHTDGTIKIGWISGDYNKSDIGTKTTIHTNRRYELLNYIFNEKLSTITKKYHGNDSET